jgi:hypothetical protein
MPALSKFLVLFAILLLANLGDALINLSSAAGNLVWVNHLIELQQPMRDPMNEPSCKLICEPTKQMDLDAERPNFLSPKKTQVTYSEQKQDAELPSKIIDLTDTQFCGFYNDKKSEGVTFSKQEKDAVLLYYLLSKHTQSTNDQMNDPNHYKEEPLQKQCCTDLGIQPLQKHCCTDLGIQSKLIITSEKKDGRQQSTHSENSEGGRLVLLLLSSHKSVGIQPLSLCLTNNLWQT